ncbi:PEP-CTERM/exosortase system-associated acyltransferase [Bowmanella denitrificans]|uniref:PEP-CTERM/exosortase system-associated acyltransferase n=1 Tax=Bowmanella denitrificans TaxID=366582 RepID=UPI000C9D0FE4|nr:PEP-CTERM/exosortase system-associated acyltransferase [Bowmanella denitrificans]
MKKLRWLAERPVIGPIVKRAMGYMVNREATNITKHFSEFLTPTLALDEAARAEAFSIRHQVYCKELKFEDENPDGIEMDDFDAYSILCMIKHIRTGNFAGTVRIVRPTEESQLLPIEKYCSNAIGSDKINPSNFARSEICEISRLAVPAQFRRRQTDKFKGAETGVINEYTYSEKELRCFPFIAIGLYLTAASVVIQAGIKHTFVMMEPRLARSMKFVGIEFDQIGPAVEYHGIRAPYYINPELLLRNLTPGFKHMLTSITQSVDAQLKNVDSI